MAGAILKKIRNGAKTMVAKGKTYGKKKGRDLASIFLDLSISPTKPGTNAVTRILAPTPNSENEALLQPTATADEEPPSESADENGSAEPERELAFETANQYENKENRPRRKARLDKRSEETKAKDQKPTEIAELTSLSLVGDEVVDFQKFCKGWEKEIELTKIGQGSFATVLKMELKGAPGQYSVWKLMPLKPSRGNGSRPRHHQTLIKDAATEVKMLVAMSDVDGFVQFRSAYVVQGLVPDQICEAHESFAQNLRPDDTWYGTDLKEEYPSKNQLWLLMEMTDAGVDLDFSLSAARLNGTSFSIYETWDYFWGIAEALMRGEAHAEFEHRDLHPGNVCIKKREKPLELTAEHGIPRLSEREVTLIDYTQSRLTLESGDVLAIAVDESIFRQTDADPVAQRQYETYRTMRDIVRKAKAPGVSTTDMWKNAVPMTNVLWLHYFLTELIMLTQKTRRTQEESNLIDALVRLEPKLRPDISKRWEYHSAREVILGFLEVIQPSIHICSKNSNPKSR